MAWWMLAAAALAGPPPEDLDLEDVSAWEDRAFALTEGPPGCWILRGEFEVRVAVYLPSTFFSRGETDTITHRGTFEGTLEGGVWRHFAYRTAPPSAEELAERQLEHDGSVDLRPLVGRFDSDIIERVDEPAPEPEGSDEDNRSVSVSVGTGSDDTMNLLRASIEKWWGSTVQTSYMRWDAAQDGAVLVMEVPTSDRRGAELVTLEAFFPGGGAVATQIDSMLPSRIAIGEGMVKAKVMNGQLHLKGTVIDGVLLPVAESWGGVIGALGFTGGYEQRIAYTSAEECPP